MWACVLCLSTRMCALQLTLSLTWQGVWWLVTNYLVLSALLQADLTWWVLEMPEKRDNISSLPGFWIGSWTAWMPAFEVLWLLSPRMVRYPRCRRVWYMSSFLAVGVSVSHGMPFLSSVFLGHRLGSGILGDTSYALCSWVHPGVRALALCPENSEPNLASGTGDMHSECSVHTELCIMKSGKASQKRWHLKWIWKDELTWAKWRMAFQGGRGARINIGT